LQLRKPNILGINDYHGSPLFSWPFIGFALSLVVPSLAQVQKYLGTIGITIYIFVAFSVLLCGYKYILPRFISHVTEKQALWLTAVTFLVLIFVFAMIYPVANSGIIGGGSDREDNINIATTALLRGNYPYYPKGYLGSPTHSLPGSLLLAVPFVLLGNSAYQNFFWLFGFYVVSALCLKDRRLALLLLWSILLLSPAVQHEFITGGDLISNSIYIMLFMILMVNATQSTNRGHLKKLISAILLGIGLSSRANFLFLLPLIFSKLAQDSGWNFATKLIFLTCASFATVTIPFYLYDPDNFYPLHSLGVITIFHTILPSVDIIILLTVSVLALLLSFQRMDDNYKVLLRNSAIVQAVPVLFVVGLSTIQAGNLDFSLAGYGLHFLFFGVLASWISLVEKTTATSYNNLTAVPGRFNAPDKGVCTSYSTLAISPVTR
jgi:hypothetical protein